MNRDEICTARDGRVKALEQMLFVLVPVLLLTLFLRHWASEDAIAFAFHNC